MILSAALSLRPIIPICVTESGFEEVSHIYMGCKSRFTAVG
jgi:hypothetical protein